MRYTVCLKWRHCLNILATGNLETILQSGRIFLTPRKLLQNDLCWHGIFHFHFVFLFILSIHNSLFFPDSSLPSCFQLNKLGFRYYHKEERQESNQNFKMQTNFSIEPNIRTKFDFSMKPNFRIRLDFGLKTNFRIRFDFSIKLNFRIRFDLSIKPVLEKTLSVQLYSRH